MPNPRLRRRSIPDGRSGGAFLRGHRNLGIHVLQPVILCVVGRPARPAKRAAATAAARRQRQPARRPVRVCPVLKARCWGKVSGMLRWRRNASPRMTGRAPWRVARCWCACCRPLDAADGLEASGRYVPLLLVLPARTMLHGRMLESRRGGRAVEGARLESVYTPKRCIEGSNPFLSATIYLKRERRLCFASFFRRLIEEFTWPTRKSLQSLARPVRRAADSAARSWRMPRAGSRAAR